MCLKSRYGNREAQSRTKKYERVAGDAVRAYKMSLKKAQSFKLPGVDHAITNELQQLMNKKYVVPYKKGKLIQSRSKEKRDTIPHTYEK